MEERVGIQAGGKVRAQEAGLRHAKYFCRVLEEADNLYRRGGDNILLGLQQFDEEWSQIQAGQVWAAKNKEEVSIDYPNAGAYLLDLRLRPRDRITWLEAAIATARQLQDQVKKRWAAVDSLNMAVITNLVYSGLPEKCKISEGVNLSDLGLAYTEIGEIQKAIDCHERALKIIQEIGDQKFTEGAIHGHLGLAYGVLGKRQKAIECHQKALQIARELGDRHSEGVHLGNLGNLHHQVGDLQKAIQCHEKALAIAREIGDRRGEGADLGNLGNACKSQGEYRRAITFYNQSLTIDRSIGDQHGEWLGLSNMGEAFALLGETNRAVECYEKAANLAHDLGDQSLVAQTLYSLGIALHTSGDQEAGIRQMEQALAIFETVEPRNAEVARNTLLKWGVKD